ncbi:MAG: hypothetical protein M3295_04150 [Chloroflexota bacterium]|nr:hypothetical protein [Chloroflexota bacterium]
MTADERVVSDSTLDPLGAVWYGFLSWWGLLAALLIALPPLVVTLAFARCDIGGDGLGGGIELAALSLCGGGYAAYAIAGMLAFIAVAGVLLALANLIPTPLHAAEFVRLGAAAQIAGVLAFMLRLVLLNRTPGPGADPVAQQAFAVGFGGWLFLLDAAFATAVVMQALGFAVAAVVAWRWEAAIGPRWLAVLLAVAALLALVLALDSASGCLCLIGLGDLSGPPVLVAYLVVLIGACLALFVVSRQALSASAGLAAS